MQRQRLLALSAAAAVLVGGTALLNDSNYQVDLVMPSAAQISKRTPVWVNGHHAGQVSNLRVMNGKAVVTVSIDDDFAPLHDGTTTRVEWTSAVGERVLTVYPGPAENAEIHDGAFVEVKGSQIEVDQVLQTLDAKTRQRLTSLLGLWGEETRWSMASRLPPLPEKEQRPEGLESLAVRQRLDLAASEQ